MLYCTHSIYSSYSTCLHWLSGRGRICVDSRNLSYQIHLRSPSLPGSLSSISPSAQHSLWKWRNCRINHGTIGWMRICLRRFMPMTFLIGRIQCASSHGCQASCLASHSRYSWSHRQVLFILAKRKHASPVCSSPILIRSHRGKLGSSTFKLTLSDDVKLLRIHHIIGVCAIG